MTTTEIPGYDSVIPGVYVPKSRINGLLVPALLVQTVTIPTTQQIVDFLKETAEGISAPPEKRRYKDIDNLLRQKDTDLTQRLARGDKESLEHLAKHVGYTPLRRGSSYLTSVEGYILPEFTDATRARTTLANLDIEEDITPELYFMMMKKTPLSNWGLAILLREDKTIDLAELDYMLDKKVRVSEVLTCEGEQKDYATIYAKASLLSRMFRAASHMSNLPDCSEFMLKTQAERAYTTTNSCEQIKSAVSATIKIHEKKVDIKDIEEGGFFFS